MSKVIDLNAQSGFPMAPEAGSETFGCTVTPLAEGTGLTGLGAMLVSIEPGKRAFPFHNHLGNDEAFVVLEGEGVFRFGETETPVKAGSFCAAPKGGPETAHQLVNTGTGPLRYVGLSTRVDPDVVEYPDSGKFAALAIAPGPNFMQAHLKYVGRVENSLDYWDGENA
ncbi:cupin domain-containing protein [Pseudoruegeria sp. SHC-113]|uniref:cupin domain-containing protein n=1 Tax=Pseudoruegeria sp. SHC-113 TaxID=2855439 RepID=UPI0021BAF435|nr:cupin domain-containing protein [Pseudoruegeria sp. SHC-113]MCT8160522.1 cupin domain-containing protein [Pseudoruegeria sp. SHC-113]